MMKSIGALKIWHVVCMHLAKQFLLPLPHILLLEISSLMGNIGPLLQSLFNIQRSHREHTLAITTLV